MQTRKLYRDILRERYELEISDEYRLYFKELMGKTFGTKSIAYDSILEEVIIEWDNFIDELNYNSSINKESFEYDLEAIKEPIEALLNSKSDLPEHKEVLLILELLERKFLERKNRLALR